MTQRRFTLRDLEREAAKFGGHVEDDSAGRWITYQVCAPRGKVWADGWCLHIVVTTTRGPKEWLWEAIEDGISRVRCGVEDDEEAWDGEDGT